MTRQTISNPKRIEKVRRRSLKSFKVGLVYIVMMFHPKAVKTIYPLLFTIIKDFFLLQFFEKWHIYHIPIVHVDHPLDKKVPFTPERVHIYLDFINFWIRPLEMLLHRFGINQGIEYCNEWLKRLHQTYKEAARLYKFRLSTTERPNYTKTLAFKQIHALDPHYCCVPSLHIAIVSLCYAFYKELFERLDFTQEEKENWNKELYEEAVAIAETVLYIKQHSVNCIPAALYMITKLDGDIFTSDEAIRFINDLFRKQTDVTEDDKKAINEHINYMYERLLLEGLLFEDWREPVQRWIINYESSKQIAVNQ